MAGQLETAVEDITVAAEESYRGGAEVIENIIGAMHAIGGAQEDYALAWGETVGHVGATFERHGQAAEGILFDATAEAPEEALASVADETASVVEEAAETVYNAFGEKNDQTNELIAYIYDQTDILGELASA